MARKAINARDGGLETIRRINRWMIAGAIGLSGVVSVAAAKSFHGHTTAQSQPAQTQTSSTPAPSSSSPSDDGSSLQPPTQAPAPAPVPQGPAVSSGGS